jgi:cell division protein FtsN
MTNNVNKSYRRQRGGTVVGIIIGLVIGLAIALVVAVAITKSSLPFLNKVGKADKAPELTAGQTSDPNKPLYGNNGAAKDAAKDFATNPDGTPVATVDGKPVASGAVVTPPATAAVPATPAPSPKPVDVKTAEAPKTAELAAAATAAAAKPDNPDDKWMYFLQAGAFREQADAENSKAKLALAGFEASISDRPGDTGPLFRVRIGPFNQLEAMNKVRGKLSDNGIDVAVVRIAK